MVLKGEYEHRWFVVECGAKSGALLSSLVECGPFNILITLNRSLWKGKFVPSFFLDSEATISTRSRRSVNKKPSPQHGKAKCSGKLSTYHTGEQRKRSGVTRSGRQNATWTGDKENDSVGEEIDTRYTADPYWYTDASMTGDQRF